MKKITLKQILVLLSVFIAGFTFHLSADSEYCYTLIDPTPATTGEEFYISWNTEANGDITISITGVPPENSANTAFRANGWSDPRVAQLTVNGDLNGIYNEEAVLQGYKYFTRTINADKSKITLVKQGEIPDNATIYINQALEYRAGTYTNQWPTIEFTYTYGSTCTEKQPIALQTPVISDIDNTGMITFTSDDNAGAYLLTVYRENSSLPEHAQEITSGSVINYSIPGDYTVTVQALSHSLDYLNSNPSAVHYWTIPGEREPVAVGFSKYCDAQMGSGNGLALITWNTDEDGTIVIDIAGFDGDANTAFRATGMAAANFSVNGHAGTWFSGALNPENTRLVMTPLIPLYEGDQITYNGYVTYRTSKDGNLYPTLTFDFVYGSKCGGAPAVTTSASTIYFSPDESKQLFTISGENLTGPLTLTVPRGITVSLDVLTPDENGSIAPQSVVVSWTEGTSKGGKIGIVGGGLAIPKEILIVSSGFSEFCNRVITQADAGATDHAYLNVELSADKMQLSFFIDPYRADETVFWNGNSIAAGKIKINGVLFEEGFYPARALENENKTIVITFDEPLADGDTIAFGNPLVWTIQKNGTTINGNCYINAEQNYIVGLGCDVQDGELAVVSVGEATDITKTSAQVAVTVSSGAYPVEKVSFKEDDSKVADIILNKNRNNIYKLEGLSPDNAYSFSVFVIDTEGNESTPFAEKLTFETLKSVLLSVQSVGEATEITKTSAKVIVEVTDGDYPLDKIRFKEDNDKVGDIVLNKQANNIYLLEGLTLNTAYSFSVTAIDTEANESAPFAEKLTFRTLESVFVSVKSVGNAYDTTNTSVKVQVEVNEGDYPLDKIRFKEDSNQVAEILLEKQSNNVYLLEGLVVNTTYSFAVSAIDTESNESEVFTTKLIFRISPSSVDDIYENAFYVYPVPATDILHVSVAGLAEIRILDLQGKLLLKELNSNSINVSSLVAGMYLIEVIDTAKNQFTRKITIR